MKKTVLLMVAMLTTMAAFAENKFYIPDFTIAAGETVEVEIMLDNSDVFSAMQADIYLPDGLTIEQEDGEYIFDLTDRKARNHTASSTVLSDGGIRILVSSQTSKTFSGNSGALVVFNLTASEDLASGDYVISMTNIIGSDAESNLTYMDDAECNVHVEGATPGPDPEGDRFYINDFTIAPGETVEVEIMLDNETAYTALQADIYLPEGLSVEMEDDEYIFDLTDRKARNHTVSSTVLSDGGIRILIASQTSKTFSGNSGALVVFNLMAVEDLPGGNYVITMKNIIASEPDQTVHNLSEETCTVTCPYDAPGVPLAEVLTEGEEGEEYVISNALAVASVSEDGMYAYVTDGEGNWARLAGDAVANLEQGLGIEGVAGTLSSLATAPTITLNAELNLAEAPAFTIDALDLQRWDVNDVPSVRPVPCQVITVNGFFDGVKLRAFRRAPQGRGVAVDLSHSTATFEVGKRYTTTAAIELIEPWESEESGAPRRIKSSDRDALDNIKASILASEEDVETGITDFAADGDSDGIFYNLFGQPVKNPTTGIYICDGKKIIVK